MESKEINLSDMEKICDGFEMPLYLNTAVAYLFCNGNAFFFDREGQSISDMQREGLCGLHMFCTIFATDRDIYWADWSTKNRFLIPDECIDSLLNCLREQPKEK